MLDAALADQFIVQAVVRGRGAVEVQEFPSHELAPEQAQPLLAETENDGHDGGSGKHHHVQNGLFHENRRVAVREGAHEIPAHVTVDDVQAVDADQQENQRAKQ